MDINVDLNDIINDLLDQVKALTLENLILKKALESYRMFPSEDSDT